MDCASGSWFISLGGGGVCASSSRISQFVTFLYGLYASLQPLSATIDAERSVVGCFLLGGIGRARWFAAMVVATAVGKFGCWLDLFWSDSFDSDD